MVDKASPSSIPPPVSKKNANPPAPDDKIPVLTQIVSADELTDKEASQSLQSDRKRRLQLRQQFEAEMNKKIRRTLQETERRLQKEMRQQLEQLFKQLDI